ncbi:C-X-C motif chemokine 16 [Microtus ochrogaster]|uniref:C-X-C motif chemokine 16 n=1 Tax=Microtus ochrogaster TaxID=79684 RepID=A0ABM0KNF4_MICOH|nr:C-X-C motif chemokine 16 [Microtus ochrogaster]
MRQGFGPLPLAPFLYLLALLTPPGDGNQGSVTGSCSCKKTIPPATLVPATSLNYIRQHLQTYDHCPLITRFWLTKSGKSFTVCGDSREQWVLDLVKCVDSKECGNGHGKSLHHQEHLPHTNTQIPVATKGTPPATSTPAQMQSTQQSTFPSGALSLNKGATHHSETSTLTSGYEGTALTSGFDPEARLEAEANKNHQEDKQQEGKPGASAGKAALVPVLSLLAIVFLLTAAMAYVLCSRRDRQRRDADLQLHYTLVNSSA